MKVWNEREKKSEMRRQRDKSAAERLTAAHTAKPSRPSTNSAGRSLA